MGDIVGVVDDDYRYDTNTYNDDDDDSDGDKTVASSNVGGSVGGDDNNSDAGTSLYSYIPDDNSLTASLVMGPFTANKKSRELQAQQQQSSSPPKKKQEPTTMEKVQKKSI